MKEKLAKEYFHGVEGLNCVQSVLKVYQDEFNLSNEFIAQAQVYGGGRAENGVCGALYAVKMMIGDSNPEYIEALGETLEMEAGSVSCNDIKSKEQLSCRDCVGLMAKNFEKYIK